MPRTFIALLRGINVGGKNALTMRDLKELLGGLALKEVQTYIQSGNVVFQSDGDNSAALALKIAEAVSEGYGLSPQVVVFDLHHLESVVASNPFRDAEAEPKTLHVFFSASPPLTPNLRALETLKTASERFELGHGALYLHAPDGIGRSKLAAKVETHLAVPVTARNWRTVMRVLEMARDLAEKGAA